MWYGKSSPVWIRASSPPPRGARPPPRAAASSPLAPPDSRLLLATVAVGRVRSGGVDTGIASDRVGWAGNETAMFFFLSRAETNGSFAV
jgi:hypothetical protein